MGSPNSPDAPQLHVVPSHDSVVDNMGQRGMSLTPAEIVEACKSLDSTAPSTFNEHQEAKKIRFFRRIVSVLVGAAITLATFWIGISAKKVVETSHIDVNVGNSSRYDLFMSYVLCSCFVIVCSIILLFLSMLLGDG